MNSTNPRVAPAGIARVELVRLRPPQNRWFQLLIQSGSKFVEGGWTSLWTRNRIRMPGAVIAWRSIRRNLERSDGSDRLLPFLFSLSFNLFNLSHVFFIRTFFSKVNFELFGKREEILASMKNLRDLIMLELF